jgi:hypothetical protein
MDSLIPTRLFLRLALPQAFADVFLFTPKRRLGRRLALPDSRFRGWRSAGRSNLSRRGEPPGEPLFRNTGEEIVFSSNNRKYYNAAHH